jgi:hypothetical protein
MSVLGIDVGGVIISREGDGGDTSFFSDNYLKTPASKDVLEVLSRIVPKFEHTFIISKCGSKVQQKTLDWMSAQHFYHRTGISRQDFFFCKTRPEKAGIAQRLGVTHYVDDRMDILNSMIGIVPNLFLFNPLQRATVTQKSFHIVPSWAAFERLLEVIDKRKKA